MDKNEISALVSLAGVLLATFGITGVDSTTLNGAINGLISIFVIGAAVWSWWAHHTQSAAQK